MARINEPCPHTTLHNTITLKQISEATHLGQWAVSPDMISAYCHILIAKRHLCFLDV